MSPCTMFHVIALTLATLSSPALAKGFLLERKGSLRSTVDAKVLQSNLRNAMGEAMGCGGQVGEERLAEIQDALTPLWISLPKLSSGRVERRSLRYLVHSYFYRKSALLIRGFEPSRPLNASDWGSGEILSQRVPWYVEAILESKHAQEKGFDLQDAALVVSTVEQLVFDSESELLERVYSRRNMTPGAQLTAQGMGQVLEEYMIHWLLGEDEEGIELVLGDRAYLREAINSWDEIVALVRGQVRAMDFQRQRAPAAAARSGRNALSSDYSFEDAHQVVGGITKSFGSFWESECASLKSALVEMDVHKTGRVPLSRFYSSALNSEWRFSESEAYLRELGALDETSRWYGKQLIIPNYIQSASNCIIATPHYMVCCANECEGLLSEIEGRVRSPRPTPEEVLGLVGNMTSQATIDDEQPPHLGGSMKSQLEQIAAMHGGTVPLHGRLFAQWLHYVFPRECPFPHKTGTAAPVTPLEFGHKSLATGEEMLEHASTLNSTNATVGMDKEELQWMSQWSSEEELILEYDKVLQAPWKAPVFLGSLAFLLAGGFASTISKSRCAADSKTGLLPVHGKSHMV